MSDFRAVKLATLAYLADGNHAHLQQIDGYKDARRFLRWLDEAGLALYLLDQCDNCGDIAFLSDWYAAPLQRRRADNRPRVTRQLASFREAVTVLQESRIPFAVLKGFSLYPEFCSSIFSRHHIDTDLLVSPRDVARVVEELTEIGYVVEGVEPFGEVRLVRNPLAVPATAEDSVYAIRCEERIELHQALFERRPQSPFDISSDWQSGIRFKELEGGTFPTVGQADAFTLHVMHAFQHLATGWLRLSWLYELQQFMETQRNSVALWRSVVDRVSSHQRSSYAFGLTLLLTSTLFRSEFPSTLAGKVLEPVPQFLLKWNEVHGVDAALGDFRQHSRHFELIHGHFFASSSERRKLRLIVWANRTKLLLRHWNEPAFLIRAGLRQLEAFHQKLRWKLICK